MKFLLILLFPIISFAKPMYFFASSEVPAEFSDLIISIQRIEGQGAKSVEVQLKEIDSAFQMLSKEEIFFLTKTEIYKYFLRNSPKLPLKSNSFSVESVTKLEKFLNQKELLPFVKWFLTGISRDLELIFNSEGFSSYLSYRLKPNVRLTQKIRKVKKRLELLLPWYELTQSSNVNDINKSFLPIMKKCLTSIKTQSTRLVLFSRFTDNKKASISSTMKFFKLQEGTISNNKLNRDGVNEILDPIIEEHKKAGLPVPTNEWVPNENDFAQAKTPLAVPTPDPNYIPPNALPKPVDDWGVDIN